MHTVVTSFSQEGWNCYARTFVESFYEHFPEEVSLLSYWEGPRPTNSGIPLAGYNLLELEPCTSFLARHRGSLEVRGIKEGRQPWAPKAKRLEYSLRHDAYKFARKVFAVADAARRVGRGRLYWIDADVVCKRRIKTEFLCNVLPEDISLAYIYRGPQYHSELGFVGYNLDRVETHAFLTAYEAEYSEDCFLRRQFWDDCNVFDALVRELGPTTKHIGFVSRHQPFDNGPLGKYMYHLKGTRKLAENK